MLTRREFLKGSSAIAASLAASSPALPATPGPAHPLPQAESALLLPPFLSRPTQTSLRITALSRKPPVETALELRREGQGDWMRQQPPLRLSFREVLDWTVNQLSPATRYQYRVLLKAGADESLRPVATGSFWT